jgi:hypothetical protein
MVLLKSTNSPNGPPNPFLKRPARFNLLKMSALEIFEKHGLLNPPMFAVLSGFFPMRAAYTYLLRLHRFGLLLRRRDERGLILYQISQRGLERLAWLKADIETTRRRQRQIEREARGQRL